MRLPVLLVSFIAVATALGDTNNATEISKETLTVSASANPKEILKASETADPSKVEIVKQIRRLNDDGSYTIGYEADDGTFKIESRDVVGNVKGTFGYIDKNGEIKRVTYSSSSDSTLVPVTSISTSTTPSPPTMIVRMNKTVSSSASSTKRPQLATVVYPTRSSFTTRNPVIHNMPRRRTSTTTRATTMTETTTDKVEQSTSNILNLYKPKSEETVMKKTQTLKPVSAKDDLITRQTTTKVPHTVKPVYEQVTEKEQVSEPKANTIRRELTNTSPNPHMISLQQSIGDDSTDVYGSHLSLGTARPLFTTTTPRPRLVPIHSLVAARQKIHQQYRDIPVQEQETTVEASTGRVFDQENVVTSSPVPVVHIPPHRIDDDRIYEQHLYRRPSASVHFRTNEYLKDNPGAPVPIGNQRPFLHFQNQQTILEPQYKEPQYVKETPQQSKGTAPEAVTAQPYNVRPPVTRIIPIPVNERGVPIQDYQRYVNVNPYRPTQSPQVLLQPVQAVNPVQEMNSISAPVSTRDLKRLLQILILRQNRLQALMDQIVAPGPPYQPLPLFRAEPQPRYEYERYQQRRQYPDDDRYDYRYEPQYRQQEIYSNQVSNYEPQYENQRYLPRRRLYTSTRPYDTAGSSSNRIEEMEEYLPAEIREALLLKMLILAISPDFMPSPPPPLLTEMTTAAPPVARKQVRNVQILGEEGSMDEVKKHMQRH